MRIVLWAFFIVLLGHGVAAQPSVPIWEIGTSARALALGGALVALADDENAVFYNPAGLAFLSKGAVAAFYHRAFGVLHHVALTGAMRGWGAQVIQIDTGPLESTNEFGNPSGEGAHYASRAGLFSVALGIENFALGFRAKVHSGEIQTGWGIDIATLVHWSNLGVGLMGENILGSSAMTFRAGAALAFVFSPRVRVTTALEVWDVLNRPELHVGLEASVNGVQIRLGYDSIAVITGAGVQWGKIRLDWAYRMHPHLPPSSVVTVAYLF